MSHPRFGFSWEGFVIEHVIGILQAERDAHFWGTHAASELDLVVPRGGKLFGFECKYADAPAATKSMHDAREELGLEKLFVIYPGTRSLELGKRIEALPFAEMSAALSGI